MYLVFLARYEILDTRYKEYKIDKYFMQIIIVIPFIRGVCF